MHDNAAFSYTRADQKMLIVPVELLKMSELIDGRAVLNFQR